MTTSRRPAEPGNFLTSRYQGQSVSHYQLVMNMQNPTSLGEQLKCHAGFPFKHQVVCACFVLLLQRMFFWF